MVCESFFLLVNMVSKDTPHEMSVTTIDDDEATQPYASLPSENALVPYTVYTGNSIKS